MPRPRGGHGLRLIHTAAWVPRGARTASRNGNLPGEATIRLAVMVTVLLSIVAHGVSALPGIELHAGRIAALGPDAPEHQQIEEVTAS